MVRAGMMAGMLAAGAAAATGPAHAGEDFAVSMVRMFNAFSDSMSPRPVEAAFPGRITTIQGPVWGVSHDWSYEFRPAGQAYIVNVFQQFDSGRPVRSAIFAFPAGHRVTDASGQCASIRPIVQGLVKSGWSLPQIKRRFARGKTFADIYLQRGAVTVTLGAVYDLPTGALPPETAALAGCLASFDVRTGDWSMARIMTAKPFDAKALLVKGVAQAP